MVCNLIFELEVQVSVDKWCNKTFFGLAALLWLLMEMGLLVG